MSVLYSPVITETMRKSDARHRAFVSAPTRAPLALPAPTPLDALVETAKAEDALPTAPDETWEERQMRIHPPLEAKPLWFSIEDEVTAEPLRPRIEDIQRASAQRYGVSRSDIMSARRTANVVKPRQVAMYLAKKLTLRSLPEIGRRFGGRDHTTVLHAVRKVEALVAKDDGLRGDVEMLTQILMETI